MKKSYLSFDPRILLGDSLGLVLYRAFAEAYLKKNYSTEAGLYKKYLACFPGERYEHSVEVFSKLIESMSIKKYDYNFPVAAMPKAFVFCNGAHRMAASMALGFKDIPYLYITKNNKSSSIVYKEIFTDIEYRFLAACQKKYIDALPRKKKLLCNIRKFIAENAKSFSGAPFSSSVHIDNCILPYQGLKCIGLTGKRCAEKRFSIYHLDKYLHKNMRLLETGCNCGFLSFLCTKYVYQVDAFDANRDYIYIASLLKESLNIKNINYSVSLFENYNPGKTYDFIISCAVYGWTQLSFQAFVDRLHAWLAPGGILLFESHELIAHPEWKAQRAYLANKYTMLDCGYIDDVDHSLYDSEYREFLILKNDKI